MDGGAWRAIVHGVAELDLTEPVSVSTDGLQSHDAVFPLLGHPPGPKNTHSSQAEISLTHLRGPCYGTEHRAWHTAGSQ